MLHPKWLFLGIFLLFACSSKQVTQSKPQMPQAPEVIQSSMPDSFQQTVKPMLARNCAPCHVPGGKMYDRLPFDQAEVVLQKKDSILRRLKSADDQTALQKWAEAQTIE